MAILLNSVFTIFACIKNSITSMKQLLSTLLAMTLFISCSKDKEIITDYTAKNDQEIKDYLAKNNLTAQKSDSGLYYIINEPGTGTQPTSTSNVTVVYKGYFTNGNVFDQSKTEGFSFGLNQVIKGWTEGLQLMSEGSKYKFYIPYNLAYGDRAMGEIIPAKSDLIFEVELLKINTP